MIELVRNFLEMDIKKALEILEISSLTDISDVKKAFHQKAHELHPDKNPSQDTSDKFRAAMEAYQYCLQNKEELGAFLTTYFEEKEISVTEVVTNLEDIFEDIFGFSKSGRVLGFQEPQEVFLTVEELALGVKKVKKLNSFIQCETCDGVGAKKGTSARICSYCFGKGAITTPGQLVKKCPKCIGRGRIIEKACEDCNGFGRIAIQTKQEFVISPGFKVNEIYTITGKDLKTNKETNIFVKIKLYKDPIFQIENYNLLCEYHIDLTTLDKNQNILVKTPIDEVPVHLDRNVKSGQVINIPSGGLYTNPTKSSRGDLRIKIIHKKTPFYKKILKRIFS